MSSFDYFVYYLTACLTDQNHIQLTWQHPTLPSAHGAIPAQIDYSKTFCMSTLMVLRLSSEDLLKKVKCKGIKQREFTASLIRDKLKDADDEIATTSLRAQLVCPVSFRVMCFNVLYQACFIAGENEDSDAWKIDKLYTYPVLRCAFVSSDERKKTHLVMSCV